MNKRERPGLWKFSALTNILGVLQVPFLSEEAVTVLVSVMIAHRLKSIKNAENAKKQSSPAKIGSGRPNANHNRHEADVQKIFYAADSILLFTQ